MYGYRHLFFLRHRSFSLRLPASFTLPLGCFTFLRKCVLYGDDDTQTADSCFLDLLRADDVFGNGEMFLMRS